MNIGGYDFEPEWLDALEMALLTRARDCCYAAWQARGDASLKVKAAQEDKRLADEAYDLAASRVGKWMGGKSHS